MQRGLPASMKAILLVGLNKFDNTWIWYDGLQDAFQKFVQGGGRVIVDHESVSPVPATQTGMQIAAYIKQSETDLTPLLLERNRDNAAKLNQAMNGIARPFVSSTSETVWAVPTLAGNTLYATVVNQGMQERTDMTDEQKQAAKVENRFVNASRVVKPQVGTLSWTTDRPIYDVRLGRKITKDEAAKCDLTQDGFRYYALPPAEVTKPVVTVAKQADGFYYADVKMVNKTPITGVPVEITVTKGTESAAVDGATGNTVKLPLADTDAPGAYTVTVKELLSGLTTTASVTVAAAKTPAPATGAVTVCDRAALLGFAARTAKPLVVALTPEQAKDAAVNAQADRLVQFYTGKGRTVTKRTIAPNDLVVSLQQYSAVQRYPQWATGEHDTILFGTVKNNLLVMDEGRGALLPQVALDVQPGQAVISYAWSPFIGEFDTVNITAADIAGLTQGVDALLAVK